MKYLQRSFTCPASDKASQEDWDRIFLSSQEFKEKYGKEKEEKD